MVLIVSKDLIDLTSGEAERSGDSRVSGYGLSEAELPHDALGKVWNSDRRAACQPS